MNATEQFVYDVCRSSFLSMWSYANPRKGAEGKELCDVLIICEPDVVIFSVKEIGVTSTADPRTQFERWVRRAVEGSAKQLYGAERYIRSGMTHVIRSDGTEGLSFPPAEQRRVHRVAVALGGDDSFPLPYGDFGKGFVHVFDETAFKTVVGELDTITDFIKYLQSKEVFLTNHNMICAGEENLLAVYLHRNRTFPSADPPILIEPDSWQKLNSRPEFRRRKSEDEVSYVWDRVVEMIANDVLHGNMEAPVTLSDAERALRVMAREDRFARRMLGKALIEFLALAEQKKIDSRIMQSPSSVGYVFLVTDGDATTDRQYRNAELGLRSLIARSKLPECSTVIGIGTERPPHRHGFSFDLLYLHLPEWSDADAARVEAIKAEHGYFQTPLTKNVHEDEYPGT